MSTDVSETNDGTQTYQEREVVAIFDAESALRQAVDALMQAGLTQEDMSVLAHDANLAGKAAPTAEQLADQPDIPRDSYVSSDSRTEGLAAVAGVPAYVVGVGAAAIVGTGGAALIPTLAIAVGGGVAAGAVGMVLARAFGRKHAARVQEQIMNGGLLLWVHAPDAAKDATIVDILTRNGGRDVHIHEVTRSWGLADRPLHDFNPDPLLS